MISSMISTIMTYKLLIFLHKINFYNELKLEINETKINEDISNEILCAIIIHLQSTKKLLKVYKNLEPNIDIDEIVQDNLIMISNISDIIDNDISLNNSDSDLDTDIELSSVSSGEQVN
jgi:hypothetical protein